MRILGAILAVGGIAVLIGYYVYYLLQAIEAVPLPVGVAIAAIVVE